MKQTLAFSRNCLDEKVRPGDDFYHYAMGGWLKQNPMPPAEARWGTFDILIKKSRSDLKAIAEKAAVRGTSPEGKMVGNFWRSALDEKRREQIGVKPVHPWLADIAAMATTKDIERFIAKAHVAGINVAFAPSVGRDAKKSDRDAFHLVQAGLSLPDRDYYLKDDVDSKKVREAYRAFIPRMLAHFGYAKQERERVRDATIRIETALAEVSMTQVEQRNPHALYNRRTAKTLSREAPHIDWQAYLAAIGAKSAKNFVVCQPKFMTGVSDLLVTVPLADWKDYLAWKVINGTAGLLTKKTKQESFNFYGKTLAGVKKMRPLWERAVVVIDGSIGDALGKLYVQEHFDAQAKKRINELVDNIFAATKERITNLEWMSSTTKKKALHKLSCIKRKLGYPDRWHAYPGLVIRADDYLGNVERTHVHEFRRQMKKIGKKSESWEWFMTPSTVNAYYDPSANEIAFPAGIMQPPFFDPSADDAMNYGAIGACIGHEITHAFDDEGGQFDAKGNLKNWWTPSDAKRFAARAEVLRKQFDSFVAIDDMHVNGKLTLGENIADLGGLLIAYDAFMRSRKGAVRHTGRSVSGKPRTLIDGFTPEQRFFLGWALFEAGHVRKESLRKSLVTDPHSPSEFRVNGSIANVDAFYEVFSIQSGDKLFIPPRKRARIW